jgi:GNAT superfamily N-acetyltransferase
MELARPAHGDDLGTLTELLTLALAAARTMRGGATLAADATPAQLLERWNGPRDASGNADTDGPRDALLVVGEFHQAVVGLGAAVALPSHSGLSGRIECCYVESEARGVGVGSALMESMVAWCSERGCTDIDALALPGDRSTKQRLEAAGFTARLLTLNRRLN